MSEPETTSLTRKLVLLVALINLIYFVVQFAVALTIRSVALMADSIDFLEDAGVNILIAGVIALGFSFRMRIGKFMAAAMLLPSVFAIWHVIQQFSEPQEPHARTIFFTAIGAAVANLVCVVLLRRVRNERSAVSRAVWLAARDDAYVNLAIILVGLITVIWVDSHLPDLLLGLIILVLNLRSARDVWRIAKDERMSLSLG